MYLIKKVASAITDISDKAWDTAEVARIELINWKEFTYKPNMEARILYSEFGIHVKLSTDDDPLVARCRAQNSEVCEDSCMEFFFSPNADDPQYFNFEFNAFGTMYMSVRKSRTDFYHPKEDKNYFSVVSEVGPDEWSVMFTVPFEFIDRELGGHTKKILGNLYKCGGDNEHYVTYYPVETDHPDFHRPEYFGDFELE